MSSKAYSASLTPDPWLRIIVLISGQLLIAAGLVLILTLEFGVAIRAIACVFWTLLGRFEMRRLQRGFASCAAIRIYPDGEVTVLNECQEWVPGRLQTGTMILRRFAWMRVQMANGSEIMEPLQGDARLSKDWRRLQVISRHIGA